MDGMDVHALLEVDDEMIMDVSFGEGDFTELRAVTPEPYTDQLEEQSPVGKGYDPKTLNADAGSQLDEYVRRLIAPIADSPQPAELPLQVPVNSPEEREDMEELRDIPTAASELSGKTFVLCVPEHIDGECVKIRYDPETKVREYYNGYFEQSVLLPPLEAEDADDEQATIVRYTLPRTNQLVELYKSLDMYEGKLMLPSLANVGRKYRPDSLLIRGVNGLSTSDVFAYLRAYDHLPEKMEWINDAQCVVIFPNQYEAARCLLSMTKPLNPDSVEAVPTVERLQERFDAVREVPKKWVQIPMPKSHVWRFHVSSDHDTKEKKGFLFSIARKEDRKQEHAERFSDYYRSHGNPNSKGKQGVWTKGGYEQKMKKKKADPLMSIPVYYPEAALSMTSKFVEDRIPAKSRLGSPPHNPKRRLNFDLDIPGANLIPAKRAKIRTFPPSASVASLRSVTLQRRTDIPDLYDKAVGTGRPYRRPEATITSNSLENSSPPRMYADSEEQGDRYWLDRGNADFQSPSWSMRKAAAGDSPAGKVPRRSIHDRLGW